MARGIFALMRETTAEGSGGTAALGARGVGVERDAVSRRVVARRVKEWVPAGFRGSGSRSFRILMFGSSISMFGSRISTVAFPMLVLHLYNSPFFTGLVAFAAIAPSLLVYVPAGVLVDHWNPRRVMLISEILRGFAITSVVVTLIIFGRRADIWFLILAMVAEEILEIFSMLAERRYLSRLMERDKLASQQACIEVRTHAAILAGRPIGPFLFSIQPIFPFLADMLSFIASIGSLMIVDKRHSKTRDDPVREPRMAPIQLVSDISRGLSWLREDRKAWVTLTLMAATSLVAQALILMLLAQAHSRDLSTIAIGIVLAASGAGGAVGSLSFKSLFKVLPDGFKGFWLPIQMILWCGTLAILWRAGGLPATWSVAAMFVLGFTGAIGNIEFGAYLVTKVADDMLGRVTAIGQMLAIGACGLGPVLGGYAIQRWGVKDAVMALFWLVSLLVFFSLLMPEVSQKFESAFRPFRRVYAQVHRTAIFSRRLSAAACRAEDDGPGGRLTQADGGREPVLSGKGGSFD